MLADLMLDAVSGELGAPRQPAQLRRNQAVSLLCRPHFLHTLAVQVPREGVHTRSVLRCVVGCTLSKSPGELAKSCSARSESWCVHRG